MVATDKKDLLVTGVKPVFKERKEKKVTLDQQEKEEKVDQMDQ